MRLAESGNAKPDNEQGAHALIVLSALGNSFGKSVSVFLMRRGGIGFPGRQYRFHPAQNTQERRL